MALAGALGELFSGYMQGKQYAQAQADKLTSENRNALHTRANSLLTALSHPKFSEDPHIAGALGQAYAETMDAIDSDGKKAAGSKNKPGGLGSLVRGVLGLHDPNDQSASTAASAHPLSSVASLLQNAELERQKAEATPMPSLTGRQAQAPASGPAEIPGSAQRGNLDGVLGPAPAAPGPQHATGVQGQMDETPTAQYLKSRYPSAFQRPAGPVSEEQWNGPQEPNRATPHGPISPGPAAQPFSDPRVDPAPPTATTALTPDQEIAYRAWMRLYAPNDSGQDYDYRGAFAAGVKPDQSGHWPDTFKKPNHPTFSDESQYRNLAPGKAGHWNGDQFTPPAAAAGTPAATAGGPAPTASPARPIAPGGRPPAAGPAAPAPGPSGAPSLRDYNTEMQSLNDNYERGVQEIRALRLSPAAIKQREADFTADYKKHADRLMADHKAETEDYLRQLEEHILEYGAYPGEKPSWSENMSDPKFRKMVAEAEALKPGMFDHLRKSDAFSDVHGEGYAAPEKIEEKERLRRIVGNRDGKSTPLQIAAANKSLQDIAAAEAAPQHLLPQQQWEKDVMDLQKTDPAAAEKLRSVGYGVFKTAMDRMENDIAGMPEGPQKRQALGLLSDMKNPEGAAKRAAVYSLMHPDRYDAPAYSAVDALREVERLGKTATPDEQTFQSLLDGGMKPLDALRQIKPGTLSDRESAIFDAAVKNGMAPIAALRQIKTADQRPRYHMGFGVDPKTGISVLTRTNEDNTSDIVRYADVRSPEQLDAKHFVTTREIVVPDLSPDGSPITDSNGVPQTKREYRSLPDPDLIQSSYLAHLITEDQRDAFFRAVSDPVGVKRKKAILDRDPIK